MADPTVKIHFPKSSPFLLDLRGRVDAYFAERNLPETATPAMVLKSVFWITLAVGLFVFSLLEIVAFPASLWVSALTGFVLACVGFNVGHDAIHGSYARSTAANRVLALSFEVMGASSLTWAVIHNVLHHTYTNICGMDQDIDAEPTVSLQPGPRPPSRVHHFQHVYAWFLYGFVALAWIFQKDFRQMLAPHPVTGKMMSARMKLGVVAGKVLHLSLFLGLPVLVVERPFWQVLTGYLVMMFCAGLTLAITFELAHVVEGMTFFSVPADGAMPLPWAEHQLATTANFGRSRLATFITGGLNFQVEHHLFPRVCHIHYPALAPIVTQCAHDHGLTVVHSGSFFSAVASHARMLKLLGAGVVTRDAPMPPAQPVLPLPLPPPELRRSA